MGGLPVKLDWSLCINCKNVQGDCGLFTCVKNGGYEPESSTTKGSGVQ